MKKEFNIFNQPEDLGVYLCRPNLDIICPIDRLIYDTEVNLRFNSLSNFKFKIPKYIDDKQNQVYHKIDGVDKSVYSMIKSKKNIFIEDIGYFIITSVSETIRGTTPILEVNAFSIEAELSYKKLVSFKAGGVPRKIVKEYGDASDGLIDILIKDYMPNWKFTDCPQQLLVEDNGKALMRGFDISDSNIYSFLMNEFQKAYNCIVIFDRMKREFKVELATPSSRQKTSIIISHDNLISTSELKENSDEMTTAMQCYGGNGLNIRTVNPIGENTIYNFDYYKNENWMSKSLIGRLDQWNAEIDSEESLVIDNFLEYSIFESACLNIGEFLYALNKRQKEIQKQKELYDNEKNSKQKQIYSDNITFLKKGDKNSSPKESSKINRDNLYKWSIYGGEEYIIYYINYYQNIIDESKNKIFVNKDIKFSTKVNKLIESYNKIAHYETILTERKNQVITQENLKKASIELGENNNLKDYKKNIDFLRDKIASVLTGDAVPLKVPEVTNPTNRLNAQEMINTEYFVGIKDDLNKTVVSTSLGSVSNLEILISSQEKLSEELLALMKMVSDKINLRNFLGNQYSEIIPFIIENVYSNNNIITTSLSTTDFIISQSVYLYNQSKKILEKVSYPRYELGISLPNFINLPEYKNNFTKELELGKVISIISGEKIIEVVLLGLDFYLDKPSELNLIFSNRLRLDDSKYEYTDLLEELVNTSSDVNSNKTSWDNWNLHRNDVTNFISSALITANNNIINSSQQEILINETGIRGRKYNQSGGYKGEEIWITNNKIGFTKDNWNTGSLVFGKVPLFNPNNPNEITDYSYGLIGETIFGNVIIGENLTITNNIDESLATFMVNEKGANIKNMELEMYANNKKNKIIINPTDGIKIEKKTSTGNYTPVFQIDSTSGNVFITGNAIFGSDVAGQWKIDINGLTYTNKTTNVINKIYPESISLGNNKFIINNQQILLGNEQTGFIVDSNGRLTIKNVIPRMQSLNVNNLMVSSLASGTFKAGNSGIGFTGTVTAEDRYLTFYSGILVGSSPK